MPKHYRNTILRAPIIQKMASKHYESEKLFEKLFPGMEKPYTESGSDVAPYFFKIYKVGHLANRDSGVPRRQLKISIVLI